ncbi:MAG: hypothetical protein NTU53_09130, partial [Planctomycetota bacterium]|nr:hypothetical protein [Planctomycetota bacterium]
MKEELCRSVGVSGCRGGDMRGTLTSSLWRSTGRGGRGAKELRPLFLVLMVVCAMGVGADERREEERLSFQTGGPWSARVNLNADVAMVYGVDKRLPDRMETWKKRGYRIQVMTGVSWGEYQDYLYGRFDGKNHEDEA